MQDVYLGEKRTNMEAAASSLFLIAPHDTNEITKGVKSIRIANKSDAWDVVTLRCIGDESDRAVDVPPKSLVIEPLRVRYVRATGTGATLVIHGYSDA